MRATAQTRDELRALGWVELWGIDVDKLEAAGVPIKLAPCPPDENGPMECWTTAPMAPRWAVELTVEWPEKLEDDLLSRVIAFAYRSEKAPTFVEAALGAYRLGGRRAVAALLETPPHEPATPPDP